MRQGTSGRETQKSKRRARKVTPAALRQVWETIAGRVLESAEDMASGLIEVAKEGNLQAAKFLFELTGVTREDLVNGTAEESQSLAALLLKKLDRESKKRDKPKADARNENTAGNVAEETSKA